jgi:hypothetical protein
MILPASYQNGFAPRDGQPLYPSLWRGCVFAAAPCLGPTGLTLRNQSGLGNNGTLTNGPTFAASQGRYAMNFDGVDDYVDAGTQLPAMTSTMSISFWINTLNIGGSRAIACQAISNSACNFTITYGFSTGAGKMNWWNDFSGIAVDSTSTINSGAWRHVVGVRTGSTGNWTITWFIDGRKDASGSLASNPQNPSTPNFTIGRFGAFSGYYVNATLDDVRIYNRALSPDEIRTLATRRGIAYEMAPRRRSSVQVTTNRRRRIIIGGTR